MWRLPQSDAVLSAASDILLPVVPRAVSPGDIPAAEATAQQEVSALYAERAAEFLRYALVLSRDEQLARDALQEAFMRYFVALCHGEQIDAPRAWVYRVLHNYLLDRLRESRARGERSLDSIRSLQETGPNPEGEVFRKEMLALAGRALTRREEECLRLRTEGLPYEEIAATLSLKPGTVGALISRAVRKLRSVLAPRRPAEG